MFVQQPGNKKIIGTVGELQFDVIKFRLEHEYGAKCTFSPLKYHKACWITTNDKASLENFILRKSDHMAYDKEENPVFFADSEWTLRTAMETFPALTFHTSSEFKNSSI
jgi:peptide chain release factor 3